MTDTETIESTMDGKPYTANRHAATLRRILWREHLGLLPSQTLDASEDPNAQPPNDCMNDNLEGPEYEFVADPLGDKVWDMWCSNASTNTEVFRDLFHADPDDCIKTFEDYASFLPDPKNKSLSKTKSKTSEQADEDKSDANQDPKQEHKQGHIYDMNRSLKEIKHELDRIKGHLVWMPLDFLCDANMAEKGLQVNAYTESIYT